jgi:hypothetical protein
MRTITILLALLLIGCSTERQCARAAKKPIWFDYYLNKFKWYRKWRKQTWYKHQFTTDALELSITFTGTWWALYGKINRYSDVIDKEVW